MQTATALFVALAAAGNPAVAQDVEEAGMVEASETGPSALDLWKEDPTTVFDASDVMLDDLRFIARPVIVFADSPADPLFTQQMDLLLARLDGLVARDVILIADTDPAARSDARQTLRPRGFALVLIGKDGRVAQRKPSPWDVRELERAIDKMPLRQQEIREANG